MKSKIKGVVIMAAALLPLVAAARSAPASSGRPQFWNEGPCFWMDGSRMSNGGPGCSGRKSFEIPLVVDSAGPKTVEVTAQGATPSNNVCCQAVGAFRDGTALGVSGRVCLSVFGPPQVITLVGAFVPSAGYLYVNCLVDLNGWVDSVNYTP